MRSEVLLLLIMAFGFGRSEKDRVKFITQDEQKIITADGNIFYSSPEIVERT